MNFERRYEIALCKQNCSEHSFVLLSVKLMNEQLLCDRRGETDTWKPQAARLSTFNSSGSAWYNSTVTQVHPADVYTLTL